MSRNPYVLLKQILPPAPVLVGRVTAHHAEDDTSTVVLPTNEGTFEYAGGVSVGSTIRARGTAVAVGDKAFVRNGVIETRAPDGDALEIEVGRVVAPHAPLVFSGPIDNQAGTEGAAFSLDVSGYWTGGAGALSFSIAAGTLPAGLALSPAAGVISGTPTAEGVAVGLVVRATDQAGYRADSNAVEFDIAAPAGANWVATRWDGSQPLMASADGSVWTEHADPSNSGGGLPWAVVFGGGKFVVVGHGAGGAITRLATSEDGETWAAGTLPAGTWVDVAYGSGVFVVVEQGNAARLSLDAITWGSFQTIPGAGSIRRLIYGNGIFVVVRITGTNTARVATSPDGATWTSRATPNVARSWASLAYSPTLGMFAAVAQDASGDNIMTSPDGVSWTLRANPAAAAGWGCLGVAPDGSFVGLGNGNGSVLRSSDGVNWTVTAGAVTSGAYRDVAHDGSRLVAVANGLLAVSTDNGATWTTAGVAGNWFSVAART